MRTHPARKYSRERKFSSVTVNVLGLLVALPAFGYSLYLYPPTELVQSAQRLAADASLSLSAAVPENPYNTLAAQLSDKQAQLDQQEAQLRNQEAAANQKTLLGQDWGLVSFGISILVLVLVGLNFYLDMRRRNPKPDALTRKFLVDLR